MEIAYKDVLSKHESTCQGHSIAEDEMLDLLNSDDTIMNSESINLHSINAPSYDMIDVLKREIMGLKEELMMLMARKGMNDSRFYDELLVDDNKAKLKEFEAQIDDLRRENALMITENTKESQVRCALESELCQLRSEHNALLIQFEEQNELYQECELDTIQLKSDLESIMVEKEKDSKIFKILENKVDELETSMVEATKAFRGISDIVDCFL